LFNIFLLVLVHRRRRLLCFHRLCWFLSHLGNVFLVIGFVTSSNAATFDKLNWKREKLKAALQSLAR
jgi:hypothetical protein